MLTAIGSFGDALAQGVVRCRWYISAAGLGTLAGPSAAGQDLGNIPV